MMDGSRSATQAKPGSEGGREGWKVDERRSIVPPGRTSISKPTQHFVLGYPALRTWLLSLGPSGTSLHPFHPSGLPPFHLSILPSFPFPRPYSAFSVSRRDLERRFKNSTTMEKAIAK
jgi:hypothetical protein